MKTERPRSSGSFCAQPAVVSMKGYGQSTASAWSPRNEDNARMATADHDRQGQAAHRQYKLRTVAGFTSGKYTHDQHP